MTPVKNPSFLGVGAKRLSEVEVKTNASNQHEFNGINEFKEILGIEKKTFKGKFIFLSDEPADRLFEEGTLTWYDARKNHPTRSEYRLYYSSGKVIPRASPGDLVVIARIDIDDLLLVVTPANSNSEKQVIKLFDLSEVKNRSVIKSFKSNSPNTEAIEENILTTFGIKQNEIELTLNFKPRARLLLQLGDQLIKNESIALIELVKNSYDADANKVDIYMENIDSLDGGTIIIEDDGYGMDAYTVENVWMEPGSDFKSQKFANREGSPKFNRLPIGEKGIGRFGVHKLGNKIEMTTKKSDSEEVFVEINWTDFNNYRYLEQVPIRIIVRESPKIFKAGKTGTSIVISNLRNQWTRGVARSVKRAVTSLISPFDTNDSFKADFDIFDKPGWFEGLLQWNDVKHYALFHFKIKIKGSSIVQFLYEFQPWSSMPKLSSRTIDENNDLVREFSLLEDEEGHHFSLDSYSIGEVIFEGYIFDRDAYLLRLGVSDKLGFKQYLDLNSGVRVFRDGLRIYDYGEPENDWLDLNLRRVNQPTKKISKNIIAGAIYVNRGDSLDLIEKTNREGFIENDAYKAFKDAIVYSLNLIETFRFSDKQKLRDIYGPNAKSEPVLQVLGDLKSYIDVKVTDPETNKEITKYLVKVEADYKRINENLLKAAGAGLSMSVVIHEVEKIILEVQKVLNVEDASERVKNLVKHLSSLIDGYADIIRNSTRTNENLIEVINQALFNTEFRRLTHTIDIIPEYRNFKGTPKTKIARSLLIGCLMNVIDNSIFWLDKANRPNKKLFINISEEDTGYLTIVVADNGTGFLLPTEDIIQPFFSGKPGGMGLGLHIASEIMIAHEGKLTFPDWGDFEIPEDFKEGAIVAFEFKK